MPVWCVAVCWLCWCGIVTWLCVGCDVEILVVSWSCDGYVLAVIVGLLPAYLVGMISGTAGMVVGVLTVGLALCTVQALEGIFKAALYEFAMGEKPAEFDLRTLQNAYRPAPEGAV